MHQVHESCARRHGSRQGGSRSEAWALAGCSSSPVEQRVNSSASAAALPSSAGETSALAVARQRGGMWLDDMDTGSRGAVLPAQGPLGRCLRATRLDLFLSQQQLATLAGTTQAAVSRLERGAPNWALFCRLIDAMGGRPVVTIESVGTDRMLFERYFGAEADDDYEGWAESGA